MKGGGKQNKKRNYILKNFETYITKRYNLGQLYSKY
jgi:hypothetical protein